ncbi:hypothetical protein RN001_000856 [Aquatica leii]|uniref:Uncharacterized protein n=1 Tax=Aquatica leii TaxID=1421715 RepID=A0AAN7Q9Z7_9COLE|nr:hypothetical protein RN001_000856 [Aquatica leii]
MNVITFNKTYEERLQEYTDVLRSASSKLCATEIQKNWSCYLQFNIDSSGWLAIWKIPRSTCELLNVEFPIAVVVYVENVDFSKLSATVKTLAVDEDVLLSNKRFIVLLIELWPLKEQEKSAELNLNATANAMDMLRIFYIYLFMPWDLEEDSSLDWLNEHLETRLSLFYDMKSNNIPKHKVLYIRELLQEARRLHLRQKQLVDDPSSRTLLSIKVSMAHIKNEIEILENRLLRSAVLRKEQQLIMPRKVDNHPITLVLLSENNISDYILWLEEVTPHVGNECVQYKSSLSSALANAIPNETILLSKSKHTFENLCSLQEGGSFKGLGAKEDTIITSMKEDIMFDVLGNISFENLTIDISIARWGILVRRGIVTLINCKLTCPFDSHAQDGVIVGYGGTLKIDNCAINGFETALVVNSGGTLYMKDSTVADVNIGLRVHANSCLIVESTQFKKCEKCAIEVSTESNEVENQSGDFDILKMSSITLNNVTGEGNGVDCSIVSVEETDLFQDMLSAESDSSSDGEMDTTVLNLYK